MPGSSPSYLAAERMYPASTAPPTATLASRRVRPLSRTRPCRTTPWWPTWSAGLADTSFEVSPIPRGIDYGDGGKCVLCPSCDGFFCAYDAKMDAETAALRPAMATGNVDLLTGRRMPEDPDQRGRQPG